MIEKSLFILYQKDSVPHAMTLMKDIEFMIGLFIPYPASIKKLVYLVNVLCIVCKVVDCMQ